MLLIPCPWCGDRAHTEFTYHGDATGERPSLDASDEEWYDYVFTRDNPRGEHTEWWHHTAGCRQWIKVRRNTFTHKISGAQPAVDNDTDSSA